MRVLILYGGRTSEYAPSFDNGSYVHSLLCLEPDLGLMTLDPAKVAEGGLVEAIRSHRPDVVFNATIGGEGENGTVQAALDAAGVPYTHSPALPSRIAFDKVRAKGVALDHDIDVLPTLYVGSREELLAHRTTLPFPCVVKPVYSGSSLGVLICHAPDDLDRDALLAAGPADEIVMVEAMADTPRNFTVAVLEDRAMAVSESELAEGHSFYSYECKLDWYGSFTRVPADLPAELALAMRAAALRMHRAIGCRDISRSDFMVSGGRARFLEINTQPVLNDRSLYTDETGKTLHEPQGFVRRLLDLAVRRS
ncbi:hypothetical protein [Azospirillum sp. Sh1]|uniref:D-alanine--D-alanine ligase family protein n=1 Tax=Azospirillum sp. Sh1 TaxID=2607285 RepID=UPI00165DF26A|nr:hypothetical protein [Azospirillum sp. Sh1]